MAGDGNTGSEQGGGARLDEATFRRAVKTALKHFVEPDVLRSNPLLDSRLVEAAAGGDPETTNRARALRQILVAQCRQLRAVPKTAGLARALETAYLNPERSQADAAALLGVSVRTYRRHLTRAVSLLAAYLWEAENGSSPPVPARRSSGRRAVH